LRGFALLIGVDRFMSEIRTITNVCGNAVAMIVVRDVGGRVRPLEGRGDPAAATAG